eukprot:augustus_masked-scaffold_13-processed-gene-4.14-mRNA-1 protein AED:0.39 eAED:0.40 QI:0/-1/0/1/-1/1/1/0/593
MKKCKRTNLGGRWKGVVYTSKDPDEKKIIKTKNEIGDIIKALTDKLCEPGCLSQEKIIIEVESPNVPDLTVIDTPGIVRTTTNEQGNENFKESVYELIKSYLRKTRTIALVVVPCNVNVATVEGLDLAAQFDPEGKRTVGVLTKPDLIDNGTEQDVLNVLQNITKPLKLGYVAVKNRGQKEIEEKVTIQEARNREEQFFMTNDSYRKFMNEGNSKLFGVHSLAAKLTGILIKRIRELLPEIEEEIAESLHNKEQEWFHLGGGRGFQEKSEADLRTELNNLVRSVCSKLSSVISGSYQAGYSKEQKLWARIYNDGFLKIKTRFEAQRPDFGGENFVLSLMEKEKASKGRSLPGFLNFSLFEEVCGEYNEKLKPYADELVDFSERALSECVCSFLKNDPNFARYPKFQSWIRLVAHNLISKLKEKALSQNHQLFKEQEKPFTLNNFYTEGDFSSANTELYRQCLLDSFKANEKWDGTNLTYMDESELVDLIEYSFSEAKQQIDPERMQMTKLSHYLERYWDVDVRRLVDNLGNLVDSCLLEEFSDQLMLQLFQELRDDNMVSVLTEDADIVELRARVRSQILLLRQGRELLQLHL